MTTSTESPQRFELMGRMATGIAHDLNNQMMLIINHLESALDQIPAHNAIRANIADVRSAADRCSEMVGALLSFGRPSNADLRPIDLGPVLAETGRLLQRVLPANIVASLAMDPDLKLVVANETLVQQIVINLALNARDAMPRGGKLVMEARNDRSGVVIAVCDSGCGMPAEVQNNMFEPYFTTKGEVGGTGLGLAIVAGLVKRQGGKITVDSVRGKGSCFRIRFPYHKMD